MKDLKKVLKEERIHGLRMRPPVCLPKETPLKRVLEMMREKKTGCAILTDEKKIVGIFTERDALTRVVEQKIDLKTPIEKLMTPDPKVLKIEDSVADAIRLMNQGGYRHIPILDSREWVQGVVSVRDILKYLAEHFPYEVYNLPPDPQVIRAPEGA